VPLLFAQTLPNVGALLELRNRLGGIEMFREDAAVLLGPDRSLISVGAFVMGRSRIEPVWFRLPRRQ
jgi:hypothetical protein